MRREFKLYPEDGRLDHALAPLSACYVKNNLEFLRSVRRLKNKYNRVSDAVAEINSARSPAFHLQSGKGKERNLSDCTWEARKDVIDKFLGEGKSVQWVSDYFKCHINTMRTKMKKYNIATPQERITKDAMASELH